MKQKLINYCNKHNLDIEISKDDYDSRKIGDININTPDGYRFNNDLHGLCYPDLTLYDWGSKEIWEFVYKDLITFSLDVRPNNCVCKQVV